MNLQDETISNKTEISLHSLDSSIQDLLIAAVHLYKKHDWQTHGLNPEISIKLIEARADLLRSIRKLEQITKLIVEKYHD